MSILKYWWAVLSYCILPMYFGGDSKSDSSTQTTNHTTNNVENNDKRNVASDSAVALSGNGNVVDRSSSSVTSFIDSSTSTSLTSFIDNSNKSTNFSDSSNRSTNFSDSSNRSVTTINTNTDHGSVAGSLGLAGSMTTKAFDVAGDAIDGAVGVLKQSSSDSLKSISMAFDTAKGQSALANASSAAVMGFASEALKATQSAMEDAKDGGQSKMVMAALGVIGAVGVALALR